MTTGTSLVKELAIPLIPTTNPERIPRNAVVDRVRASPVNFATSTTTNSTPSPANSTKEPSTETACRSSSAPSNASTNCSRSSRNPEMMPPCATGFPKPPAAKSRTTTATFPTTCRTNRFSPCASSHRSHPHPLRSGRECRTQRGSVGPPAGAAGLPPPAPDSYAPLLRKATPSIVSVFPAILLDADNPDQALERFFTPPADAKEEGGTGCRQTHRTSIRIRIRRDHQRGRIHRHQPPRRHPADRKTGGFDQDRVVRQTPGSRQAHRHGHGHRPCAPEGGSPRSNTNPGGRQRRT